MPDYNMLVKVTSQGMDQVSKGLEALGRNIDKAIAQADRLSKSIESINGSISNVDFSPMSAPAIPATTQNTVALENAVNRLASEVNKNTEAFGAFSSQMNKVQAEEKGVVTATQEAEASVHSLGGALQGIGDIALGGMLFGFAKNFVTGTIEARKETQALENQLKATFGNAANAEELATEEMKRLKEEARNTATINTSGMIQGYSAFKRMGQDADKATESTKILSNALASVDQSEGLGNVLVQMEQLAGKTGGYSQDLMAIQNYLSNLNTMLIETFGVGRDGLQELGLTGQEIVDGLLQHMQETIPEQEATFVTAMGNAKDAIHEASAAMGEAFVPVVEVGAKAISKLAEKFAAAPTWVHNTVAWGTAFTGVVGGLALTVKGVTNTISVFKEAGQAINTVIKFVKTLTTATEAETVAENLNTATVIKNTVAKWANVAASVAKQAFSGPKGWAILAGGLAVAAGVGAGIYAWKKNKERENLEAESEADAQEWLAKHQKTQTAEPAYEPEAVISQSVMSVSPQTVASQNDKIISLNEKAQDKTEDSKKKFYEKLQKKAEEAYKKKLDTAKKYISETVKAEDKALKERINILNKELNARKSYTEKVLSETEKIRGNDKTDAEKEIQRSINQKTGIALRINHTVLKENKPLTSAEVLAANQNIMTETMEKNRKLNFINHVLYGDTTARLMAEKSGTESREKYLSEVTAKHTEDIAKAVINMQNTLNSIKNMAKQDMRYSY